LEKGGIFMTANEMGSVEISDNVVKEIAARSIFSVLGIEKNDKKQKKIRKSLSIDRNPVDSVTVSVKISVPLGKPIPELAREIMEKVKSDIERMTELTVESVNVVVEDIEEPGELEESDIDEEEPKFPD